MATEAPLTPKRGSGWEEDPLVGFNYSLEIGGGLVGYFTECSGIGSEHDVVEKQYVDKDGRSFVRKVPGILKYNNVTLKRGITSDLKIWEWRADAEKGDMTKARQNCTITMYDRNFKAVAIWHFVNAWPSKVSGPDLSSDGNDFGVEEIEFVHEGFYREQ
ncbi:MAG: phage tail protein [Caldilineaceae bacterium]|nr:phage tail protein [Caldilineaceae bacterium]